MTFRSVPDTATVEVFNGAGQQIHAGTTPLTVTLKRGSGYFKAETYAVTFSKPGYLTQNMEIQGTVNGWYVGNILFGGVIGMLIVDPATGAMYSFEPDAVEIMLERDGVTLGEGDGALTVLSTEAVPDELLQMARPIKPE